MATIEDITNEPGSIATNRSEKMLLLTWHESSEPTKEPICNSITLSSLPQHDSSIPCKEPDVGRTQEPIMVEVSTQEPIVADVSNQVPIVEEVGTQEFTVEDVVLEDYVSFGEDFIQGTNDDDDEDEDFLVDEENEIMEPDVDVHLFGINMDLSFDNIGVTNLVPDDGLEGEDVDAINMDSFDSDPSNDDEKNDYKKRRVNPNISVKTVQDQLQHKLEVQISMSKAFRAKAKAEREIRGDHVLHYSMLRDYVVELQSINPSTTVKITIERNTDPSLSTRVFRRIYVCLGALKLVLEPAEEIC
ncbi:hypothetical protein Tco_0883271 [Tanacetum coccineum]